jgi:hypothetical protein
MEKPFGGHVFWQQEKGGREVPYAFLPVTVPKEIQAAALPHLFIVNILVRRIWAVRS